MRVQGRFVISHNCEFSGENYFGCGDEHQSTIDYIGDDVNELIAEFFGDHPEDYRCVPINKVANCDDRKVFVLHEFQVNDGDGWVVAYLYDRGIEYTGVAA